MAGGKYGGRRMPVDPRRVEYVRQVCQDLWDKSGHTRRPRVRDVLAVTGGYRETIRKIVRDWNIERDAAEDDERNGIVPDDTILRLVREQMRRAAAIARTDCKDAVDAALEREAVMADLLAQTVKERDALLRDNADLRAQLAALQKQTESVDD